MAQPELGTRLINLPTHLGIPSGTLEVVFTHRFNETVSDGGGEDLFGLDSAADIGIGVGAGISRQLSVELYRSSFFKQLEAAVKWQVVRQGNAFPVGFALRTGADYRGASGVGDRWSGFAQLVIKRRLTPKLDVFVLPVFASDTPTLRRASVDRNFLSHPFEGGHRRKTLSRQSKGRRRLSGGIGGHQETRSRRLCPGDGARLTARSVGAAR